MIIIDFDIARVLIRELKFRIKIYAKAYHEEKIPVRLKTLEKHILSLITITDHLHKHHYLPQGELGILLYNEIGFRFRYYKRQNIKRPSNTTATRTELLYRLLCIIKEEVGIDQFLFNP